MLEKLLLGIMSPLMKILARSRDTYANENVRLCQDFLGWMAVVTLSLLFLCSFISLFTYSFDSSTSSGYSLESLSLLFI